jgi:acetyl esterase/lipase
MMVKTLLSASAAALLSLATHAAESQTPIIDASAFLGDHYPVRHVAFPDGVTGLADVTYQNIPGFRPLTLDVYLPPGHAARHPLVLYIHGGGFTTGHSRQSGAFDDFPRVLASLAAKGYTVASLNYRLSSEAPFPAAIQDVKTAIKFLRAHEQEYGIDTAKAMTWGGSAGGHLAALAALSCGSKELEPAALPNPTADDAKVAAQSDCVQAAVTWYGVFDMSMIPGFGGTGAGNASSGMRRFMNCTDSCSPQLLEMASPKSYVKQSSPPFLLIHGSADKTVDPAQSSTFKTKMDQAGAHAELLVIPDVDHSFIGKTPEATRDASLKALKATFAFIQATLPSK